jgi:Holliday junction resolvase
LSKNKGSRTERELLHMLHEQQFGVCRVAGSGSMPIPSVDLVAGKNGRSLAIECKSGKGRRYISGGQVEELKVFSQRFGAEAWVAVRFDNFGWYFLKPEHLQKSGASNFVVHQKLVEEKGILFEELIK